MSALLQIWGDLLLHLWEATWIMLPMILLAHWGRHCSARALHLVWSLALLALVLPHAMLRELLPVGSGFQLASLPSFVERAVLVSGEEANGPTPWLTPLVTVVTALWALGAARAVIRLGRDVRHAKFVAQLGQCEDDPRIHAESARLGLPCARVRVSARVGGAITVGYLQPRIVLPSSFVAAASADELRAVLAHEAHHLRRRDPLRMLLGRLLQAALFFYPPVHVVMRGLAETNELLADEAALREGIDRSSYARALARNVESTLGAGGLLFAGMGRATSFSVRWERIENPRRYRSMTRGIALVLASLACATLGALFACAPEPRESAVTSAEQMANGTAAADAASQEIEPYDTAPSPLPNQAVVSYPEAERSAGVEGTVIVRMLVTAQGTTSDLAIQSSIEGHPAFDDEVLRVVKQWTFTPATKSGQPVPAWVQVPIRFKLS